jgi:formylglycine-generating enzyme required for sulfatase activity/Leucine-rich repeat (LRR) protein
LVDRQQNVKVLDMGLARIEETIETEAAADEGLTQIGQVMGTLDYMAPEQALDTRHADARADIYSLGCTLYKLLTGQAPFSGPQYENTFDKMMAHLSQPFPPIRQLRPDVPEKLAAVLERMVAKDRDARYAKPSQVIDDLKSFCPGCDLAGLLIHARKEAKAGASAASPLAASSGEAGAGALGAGLPPALGAGLPTPPKPPTARSPESPAHPPEARGPGRLVGPGEGGVGRPSPSAKKPAPGAKPGAPPAQKPARAAPPAEPRATAPASRLSTPPSQPPTPFDPYYKWLGIPPEEQPPNHYRLLGVRLFEEDRDVIQAAAERQTVFLRNVALGKHSMESQQLLNEIQRAKLCLLIPEEKTAYDARLRQELAAKAAAAPAAGEKAGAALGAGLPTPPTERSPAPSAREGEVRRPAPSAGRTQPALGAGLPTPPNQPTARSPAVSQGAAGVGRPAGRAEGEVRRPSPSAGRPLPDAARVQGYLRRVPPYAWIAGACAAAAVLLGVIYITTNKGTVKIEFSDAAANMEVRVDGNQIDIAGLKDPLRLSVGEHELTVTGPNYEAVGTSFRVRRGHNPVLEVTLVPVASKTPQVPASASAAGGPRSPVAGAPQSSLPKGEGMSSPSAFAAFDLNKSRQQQEACSRKSGLPVMESNSIGMKMALIPPGSFWETHGLYPQKVTVPEPFYLGIHEVTQEEFERVMGRNPSSYSPSGSNKEFITAQGSSKHPVDSVSRLEAVEFCNRLSLAERREPYYRVEGTAITPTGACSYCLPSRVAWRYAACGDEGSPPSLATQDWGDFSWFVANAGGATHPVGQKKPTAFGLYDMYGNVAEFMGQGGLAGPNLYARTNALNESRIGDGKTGAARHRGFRIARIVEKKDPSGAVATLGVDVNRPDRETAEWVFRIGGKVGVSLDGEDWPVSKPEQLPAKRLRVVCVDLRKCQVSDEDLKHLAGLRSIRRLMCTSDRVTEVGLGTIAGLQSLEDLDVSGVPVTDQGLAHLAKLKNLHALSCCSQSITDVGFQHLAALDSLEVLNLERSSAGDASLKHIGTLKRLRVLRLGRTKVGDPGLTHLAGLKDLVELSLGATRITDAGLEPLSRLSNLRRLGIPRNRFISDQCIEHLRLLPNLEELDLHANRGVTDAVVAQLSSLARLRILNLDGTQITDRGLEHIKRLPGLTSLALGNTNVSDAGMGHLTSLTSLETLVLLRTQVSDAAITHLKRLTGLHYLQLAGTKVTAAGVIELSATLRRCRVKAGPKVQAEVQRLKPSSPVAEEPEEPWEEESDSSEDAENEM